MTQHYGQLNSQQNQTAGGLISSKKQYIKMLIEKKMVEEHSASSKDLTRTPRTAVRGVLVLLHGFIHIAG